MSRSTVGRVIKEIGLKPYKRYRKQKLTAIHKENRVKTAKLWINKFGLTPKNRNFIWNKLICTDFSAYLRVTMPHNVKNSIVYGFSREEVDESGLGGVEQSKFAPGVMLWGGVCVNGLLPKKNPIFFNEWLKLYVERENKIKQTMDSRAYMQFLTEKVFPMLRKELGENVFDTWVWEDDPDTKHRTAPVLELIRTTFSNRLSVVEQCGKMSDILPIENVWGILRTKLDGMEFKDVEELKSKISQKWREIDADICSSLMLSIPKRLQAVVDKQGNQIKKE